MSLKRFAIVTAAVNILKRNGNNDSNDSNFNNQNTAVSAPIETIIQNMKDAEDTLKPIPLQYYEKDERRNQNVVSTPEVTTTEYKSTKLVSYAHDNYTLGSAIASNVSYVDGGDDDDDDGDVGVGDTGNSSNNSEGIRNYGAPITTTYYGSGFGIFHQQTIRSNGGGIALVTGSGNGVNVNTYAHGINTNVNLLLGGAMLTLMTTVLCIVCYCCHRSIKKRTEAAYRQQHQWLENDPNMEIYSVEQCYETSGLFLAESTDGLSAISTLHHEPPPSYDAVVAMQERQQLLMHQQQQLMLQQQMQHNSPPPGYRSTLDVYSVSQTTSTLTAASLNDTNEASSGCSPPSDRLSNACTFRNENAIKHHLCLNTNQLSKQHKALANANLPDLNMKKVINAQSCCSLQRAEVENMWNAAAAALAARERPTNSSPTIVASVHKSLPYTAMTVTNAIKSTSPETFGSRYLKQNSYRSGCPLCGKFRYDNESTHSLSIESGLDNLASGGIDEEEFEIRSYHNISRENQNGEEQAKGLLKNFGGNDKTQKEQEEEEDEEECSCVRLQSKQEPIGDQTQTVVNNKETSNIPCRQQATTSFSLCNNTETCYDDDDDDDDDDDNDYNNDNDGAKISYDDDDDDDEDFTVVENKFINNKANDSNLTEIITCKESYSDNNNNHNSNNNRTDSNSNISSLSLEMKTKPNTYLNNNNNNNSTSGLPAALLNSPVGSCKLLSTSTESNNADENSVASTTLNLDRINENGIISLDMSKIIDKTGLPTYDAALKLESSGYV